MQLINSYVFLKKEEEMKRDKEGNYAVVLSDSVPILFQKLFNATKEDLLDSQSKNNSISSSEKLKDLFYKRQRGNFNIILEDDSIHKINYKFICVNSSYYLDIIVSESRKTDGITILEKINSILLDTKNDINKNYLIIKSYDIISEFYCNKVYPKLNKFERKLRKLLYLIYTGRFEIDYFKKTTPDELQKNIKSKIQSKNTNKKKKELDYAQVFFELFDFHDLQSLLFDTKWTDLEKEEVENFLNDNRNLTLISDAELRNFISSIRPKSDWERFFENKKLSQDIAETIKTIGTLRNSVAHNKSFNKEQYTIMCELLKKTEIEINKAIVITETEDFIRINTDKIQRTLQNFSNNMKDILSSITEALTPAVENQKKLMGKIGGFLKGVSKAFEDSSNDT